MLPYILLMKSKCYYRWLVVTRDGETYDVPSISVNLLIGTGSYINVKGRLHLELTLLQKVDSPGQVIHII